MEHQSDISPATPATAPHRPRWAQIISDAFSPLLLPTYAMIVAMWLTPLLLLPEKSRLLSTLIIACITALIPCATILILIRLGRVSDRALSNPGQRIIPYTVAAVCYLGAAIWLHSARGPAWLWAFYTAGAVATAIAAAINFRWKISAHATAAGGLLAFVFWLSLTRLLTVPALPAISITMLIVGFVGTSRLVMHRHTLAQVMCGYLLGIAVSFAALMISIL